MAVAAAVGRQAVAGGDLGGWGGEGGSSSSGSSGCGRHAGSSPPTVVRGTLWERDPHAHLNTTHLMMVYGFWSHVEWCALAVVAHVGVPGVQQLTQSKVCA